MKTLHPNLQKKLRSLVDVEQRIALYRQAVEPEAIDLSTAENILLFDFLRENVFDWGSRTPITVKDIRYPEQVYGSQGYQKSWAAFLNNAWGISDLKEIDVYAVGGASAALECLAFCLGKKGDTVISPAPLWHGFSSIFTQRPGLNFQSFHLMAEGVDKFQLTLEDVQVAYRSTYPRPRLLVLTNPNNPLGGNYNAQLLNQIYEWVLEYTDMHIISDEIYFGSQPGGGNPFVPAYQLDVVRNAGKKKQRRVHVVWGLSKDFGLSGFAVGFVISRNKIVRKRMRGNKSYQTMSWFTPFDSLKQYVLAPLFLDQAGNFNPSLAQKAMALYAGDNDSLLCAQYTAAKQALDAGGLSYHQHNQGGLFFWLDLREFLRDRFPAENEAAREDDIVLSLSSDPQEERLRRYIEKESGVMLVPGQECHSLKPGYFRLCFTAESRERVKQGIARMAEKLNALRS